MSDDRRRFEELWDAHFEVVLAYALRRAPRDLAEEAASQTFLTAWRRLDDIPEHAQAAWLLGTCRRVLANERRGEGRGAALRRRLDAEPRAGVPDPGDAIGDRLAVRDAFRSLPAGDREVLALVAWDGLSPAEAARVVGCSAGRLRSRLFRARRRLERALATAGAAPPAAPAPPPGPRTDAAKETP